MAQEGVTSWDYCWSGGAGGSSGTCGSRRLGLLRLGLLHLGLPRVTSAVVFGDGTCQSLYTPMIVVTIENKF